MLNRHRAKSCLALRKPPSTSGPSPSPKTPARLAGTAEATHAVLELVLFAVVLRRDASLLRVVMLGMARMAMGADCA